MQHSEKLYNIQNIYDLASGDHQFVKRLLNIFITETPDTVNEMISAHNRGDVETLKRLAHRLKPSIQNLGITSIVTDLKEIEAGIEPFNNGAKLTRIAKVLLEVLEGLEADLKFEHA